MTDERRRIEDAERMARVEANIEHLTQSFDEFKDDTKKSIDEFKHETKEFHIAQTKLLDELKDGWQKFGGIVQGQVALQKQANDSTNWIAENKEFIARLREDKNDNKRRWKDFVFQYLIPYFVIPGVLYFLVTTTTKSQIDSLIK